ncbi:unnamed protein product [Acanthoscelides obtectus]|uniref:Uncharacterized protein n=1 Tax=Acanthoscelides obtectus TaxID=200917 RepID=A0A9P0Q4A0_ACAOB|nr:unnamed protein product [Acanthoscelides obtectus]CAK1682788.1 hypothetical protein AOBTE_LOCUS33882 [Acanthoscelides obtectus]
MMMAEIVDVRDVKTYKPRYLHLVVASNNYIGSTKQIFLVENEKTRGGAHSCIHKMKICLRYLGDPGYQQGIGQELGVSQAMVSQPVDRVVNSIVAQSNEWIKFP